MLLWIDGFEGYGNVIGSGISPSSAIERKYTVGSTGFGVAAGRSSGYALDLNVNGIAWGLAQQALTTSDTVVVGFAAKFDVLPTAYTFFAFYDGSTRNVKFALLSSGEIAAINDDGTTLGTTSGAGIAAGDWCYIEAKMKTHASEGTVEIRVNESVVLSVTGKKTKIGTHEYSNRFDINSILGTHFHLDDLYFLDTTGTANNDYLGNVHVLHLRPNAAGDSTQFTPDSGLNYGRVNEEVLDTGGYVQDGTSGHRDLYNYEPLPLAATVHGIMVSTDCQTTDASPFSLVTSCKSSGTISDDSSQPVGASGVVKSRLIETDPHTSSAWTKVSLDAAQFGVKVG